MWSLELFNLAFLHADTYLSFAWLGFSLPAWKNRSHRILFDFRGPNLHRTLVKHGTEWKHSPSQVRGRILDTFCAPMCCQVLFRSTNHASAQSCPAEPVQIEWVRFVFWKLLSPKLQAKMWERLWPSKIERVSHLWLMAPAFSKLLLKQSPCSLMSSTPTGKAFPSADRGNPCTCALTPLVDGFKICR